MGGYGSGRKKKYTKTFAPSAGLQAYAKGLFVKKLAKKVNRLSAAVDKKRVDTYYAGDISFNGSFDNISACIQGDAFDQRTGDIIRPTFLQLRETLTIPAGMHVIRTIVVQDTSNTGTAPTPGQLLNVTGSVDRPPLSPYVFEDLSRFKILYDKTYTLCANNNGKVSYKINISGRKMNKVHYTGSGSATYKGAIFAFHISDTNTPTLPTVVAQTSLFFEG